MLQPTSQSNKQHAKDCVHLLLALDNRQLRIGLIARDVARIFTVGGEGLIHQGAKTRSPSSSPCLATSLLIVTRWLGFQKDDSAVGYRLFVYNL